MEQSRFQYLAGQYIERTQQEVTQMQALLAGGSVDQASALQLQQMAHRINGSGALLGFVEISTIAAEVEQLLRQCVAALSASESQYIAKRLTDLQQQLQAGHSGVTANP